MDPKTLELLSLIKKGTTIVGEDENAFTYTPNQEAVDTISEVEDMYADLNKFYESLDYFNTPGGIVNSGNGS
jgi:hypothetical protein